MSKLEEKAASAFDASGIEAYEREYVFALPRRWRFDFAWPAKKVAVEIEGGVWVRGSHQRPVRFISDCEKYNRAALDHWLVLRYTSEDLKDPSTMVEQVKQALRREDG